MHIWGWKTTCQYFIVKYRESIFGNSIHDRLTQKPTTMVRVWDPEHFCKVLTLFPGNTAKLVLGLLLILRLHAENILLTKYCETLTKIRSVAMFSIQIGN